MLFGSVTHEFQRKFFQFMSSKVVNALLTQLDVVKTYPNALIITTSNLEGSIGKKRTKKNSSQSSLISLVQILHSWIELI